MDYNNGYTKREKLIKQIRAYWKAEDLTKTELAKTLNTSRTLIDYYLSSAKPYISIQRNMIFEPFYKEIERNFENLKLIKIPEPEPDSDLITIKKDAGRIKAFLHGLGCNSDKAILQKYIDLVKKIEILATDLNKEELKKDLLKKNIYFCKKRRKKRRLKSVFNNKR